MDPYALCTDFAIASAFIFLGQLLRKYIPFFQKFFVPSSMIAGFLGLICGPYVFDLLPWSEATGEYTWILIIIIFAIVGLQGLEFDKEKFKKDASRIGSFVCYGQLLACIQYSIPVLFGIFVLIPIFPNVETPAFGFLVAAGFYGGHGTAAALGSSFEKLGWENATDLAMTSATIGLMVAIFGGLLFIKWATKKGHTKYIKNFTFLPKDLRTGFIEEDKRKPLGAETMSSLAVDSLGWHVTAVLIVTYIAYTIEEFFDYMIPGFIFAFIIGLIIFFIMRKTWIGRSWDEKTFDRISGTTTDYLVFFGIALVKIPVVIEYIVPFSILMGLGILLVIIGLRFLGPAMNLNAWFERSLFVFGYMSGVYATAFALLRIVDSENKSKTLTDLPFQALVQVEALALALAPPMLMGTIGSALGYCGIFFGIGVGFFLLALIFKWWYPKVPLKDRKAVE